jgi:RPA family protein
MSPDARGPTSRPFGGFEREPARRVFAAELRETQLQFKEGEDEKSPTFALLPTGIRANRVYIVGTLTEKERRGDQNIFYHARVSDPTGTFFVIAGSYQPEAMQEIARIEPPAFVAVIGKPNVYQSPSGSMLVSVRAESIITVDAATRNCWVVDTAKNTLDRLDDPITTEDQKRARDHYHIDPKVYRQMVYDALAQIKL